MDSSKMEIVEQEQMPSVGRRSLGKIVKYAEIDEEHSSDSDDSVKGLANLSLNSRLSKLIKSPLKTRRILPEKVAIKQKAIVYGFGHQSRPLTEETAAYHRCLLNKEAGQKDRLLQLREMRNVGIWVMCCSCFKWRFLSNVKDALEICSNWICVLNDDHFGSKCEDEQSRFFREEELIDAEYSAGSIVLVKIDGFPWWPGIIDDDPDYEQFFWLEGDSNVVAYYHVVFLDAPGKASRIWVPLTSICPYYSATNTLSLANRDKYGQRLSIAKSQAENALKYDTWKRLSDYGFLTKFMHYEVNFEPESAEPPPFLRNS